MQITGLNIKENGKYISVTERSVLIGDPSDLRQISLAAGEVFPELREENGLCTKRFYADIETESLDYARLSVGDILEFNDVRLQITKKGKRCFDECPLQNEGKVCTLPEHVAFARVLKGGILKVHASGTESLKI